MNLDPTTLVSGVALSGLVVGIGVAFWTKIKTVIWQATNLFFDQAFVAGSAQHAVEAYFWAHASRSILGERRFTGSSIYVRPRGRRLEVAWEIPPSDSTTYWLGRLPVRFKRDSRKIGDDTSEGATITVLRWSLNLEKFVIECVEWYNELTHGKQDPVNMVDPNDTSTWCIDPSSPTVRSSGYRTRYRVNRIVGTAKIRAGFGGGNDDKPSGRSSRATPPNRVGPEIDHTFRPLAWAKDELGDPKPNDPMEFLAYPPHIDEVLTEARRWRRSEREYRKRGVPWRASWAFTGLPGTGKTSLVRVVAQELDLPLYQLELSTLSDNELLEAWDAARENAPSVVLLEDVHTVYNGNKLVPDGTGPSFGCLLQCLSGAQEADGVLVFLTTNDLTTLDEALGTPDPVSGRSSRPGRIGRFVTFGPLDEAGRNKVAGKILIGYPDEIATMVDRGTGMTGNQFQQLCVERVWELLIPSKPSSPVPTDASQSQLESQNMDSTI